ncbi:YceI family protein [Persicitalea sp.]|uniref:YceI family protein n=1 Tax=Persicitalea sp. TaxID=3100273 RepID=UPI003593FD2C
MKKTILSLALLATASFAFVACESKDNSDSEDMEEVAGIPDGTMNVDLAASEVNWEGTMVGMYSHSGDVKLTDGNVTVTDGKITGGNFTVDLTTINPTDDNFDPEKDRTPEKLVGHLSSDDFFAVEQNPKATFEITGSDGSTVMGNLTVRGKTNPEEVKNVTISEEGGKVTMTGDLTFDRTKYDVSFKHPMQEMVLSNDVEMKVKLVAGN